MIIDVNIYGDGSRKYPHKVRQIECDRAEECSLYKDGKCLQKPTIFGSYCKVGHTSIVDQATKYAKKHDEMMAKWRQHECYNKLKRPLRRYIDTVGNDVLLDITYVNIDPETMKISDAPFGNSIELVPREKFTVEFADKLLKYTPHGFFEKIKSYKTEDVPFILKRISEVFPDIYNGLLELDPSYKDMVPNYVGKWAYISTCNRDCTYDGFRFEGSDLVKDDWRSAFLPFGAKSAQVRIKVTDDMKYQITDNKQVLPTTKFL